MKRATANPAPSVTLTINGKTMPQHAGEASDFAKSVSITQRLPDVDERTKIDADPEDALRALLKTKRQK